MANWIVDFEAVVAPCSCGGNHSRSEQIDEIQRIVRSDLASQGMDDVIVSSQLSTGWIEISFIAEAADEDSLGGMVRVALISALHAAGFATGELFDDVEGEDGKHHLSDSAALTMEMAS